MIWYDVTYYTILWFKGSLTACADSSALALISPSTACGHYTMSSHVILRNMQYYVDYELHYNIIRCHLLAHRGFRLPQRHSCDYTYGSTMFEVIRGCLEHVQHSFLCAHRLLGYHDHISPPVLVFLGRSCFNMSCNLHDLPDTTIDTSSYNKPIQAVTVVWCWPLQVRSQSWAMRETCLASLKTAETCFGHFHGAFQRGPQAIICREWSPLSTKANLTESDWQVSFVFVDWHVVVIFWICCSLHDGRDSSEFMLQYSFMVVYSRDNSWATMSDIYEQMPGRDTMHAYMHIHTYNT